MQGREQAATQQASICAERDGGDTNGSIVVMLSTVDNEVKIEAHRGKWRKGFSLNIPMICGEGEGK